MHLHPTKIETILSRREKIAGVLAKREELGVEMTVDGICEHMTSDWYLESLVLAAETAGRPAYWTIATYHEQGYLGVACFANEYGLAVALDHYTRPLPGRDRDGLLASLIPLNAAADAELAFYDEWESARPALIAAE